MNGDPIQDERTDEPAALLASSGLVVDYPGVRALDRVDFALRAGEIHALMGENGAGKSTLVKVLSGLQRPGAGVIRLVGLEIRPASPREAQIAGISTVYQEVDVLSLMSVADNICLGRQATRFGLIRHAEMRCRAEAALARLDMKLDVARSLGDYPIAIWQMVSIARALDIDAKVLILDEPTSSLDAGEARELFRVMRRLREQGMGIVFVSHFLEHVYEVADRISVLRNGAKVGVWRTRDLPKASLIEAMTGRTIQHQERSTPTQAGDQAGGAAALEATGVGRRRAIAPTNLRVRAGESVGLAGLLGSGRTELARVMFGADAADEGVVQAGGVELRRGSIQDAIGHGVAFTPEDRKALGLILELSVRENIIVALQARRGPLRPIGMAEQQRLSTHYIKVLGVRTPSEETPVGRLSGGNQQKVLLARWLATSPKVLILDEPTRGIDVGTRAEIEVLIESLRAQGLAIIIISSELEELVRMCDRVVVLRDRRVVAELGGDDVNESTILEIIAAPASEGAIA